jgi:hypothetical protein
MKLTTLNTYFFVFARLYAFWQARCRFHRRSAHATVGDGGNGARAALVKPQP